jgi:hypothetical protein
VLAGLARAAGDGRLHGAGGLGHTDGKVDVPPGEVRGTHEIPREVAGNDAPAQRSRATLSPVHPGTFVAVHQGNRDSLQYIRAASTRTDASFSKITGLLVLSCVCLVYMFCLLDCLLV